jgi:hypothetical protein
MYSATEQTGSPGQGPGCGFILWWAIASGLGGLVGLALNLGSATALATTPLLPPVQQFVIAFLSGLGLGTVQWLVLRDYLPAIGWWEWTLYTALSGGLLGFFAPALLAGVDLSSLLATAPGTVPAPDPGSGSLAATADSAALLATAQTLLSRLAVGLLLAGALFGLAQWLVLRQYVRGAGWWVPANVLGLPLGLGVGVVGVGVLAAGAGFGLAALGRADVLSNPLASAGLGLLSGAVVNGGVGLVTAPVLMWLLGRAYPLAPRT